MDEKITLEKELQARIFIHKIAITGGLLMKDYMESQLKGNVKLPKFQVEEMADEYSNKVMQEALANGTFETLYENAWNKVSQTMPEHTKCISWRSNQ